MDIKEVLAGMDSMEDSQWTQDGAPVVDYVSDKMGEKVTRADISEVAPKFSRSNMDLTEDGETKPEPEPEAETKPDPEPEAEDNVGDDTLDISVLRAFSEADPMEANVLQHRFLNNMDPRMYPEVEAMMYAQFKEIEAKMSQLQEMKRMVKQGRAMVQLYIKRTLPDMSNQEAIQAYIRNSADQRAGKAAKIREVLGGLKPSDIAKLDPRAPIDRAFARNTARGTKRPGT